MKTLFTSLLLGLLPALAFAGATSSPPAPGFSTNPAIFAPIILVAKNVVVNTSGSPLDLVAIPVPANITRWLLSSAAAGGATCNVIAETVSGTLAAWTFTLFDGPGGTGIPLTNSATGPTTATGAGSRIPISIPTPGGSQGWSVSNTIYIHSTVNSANAGTVSFYITIFPAN